jgi:hypothetical protein
MTEIFSHIPAEFRLEKKIFKALCRCVKEYGAFPWHIIVDSNGIATNKEDCKKKIRYLLMETFGNYRYDENDSLNNIVTCFHWEELYHALTLSYSIDRCDGIDKNVLEDEGLFDKSIPVWKKWVEDIASMARIDPIHAITVLLTLQSHIAETIGTLRYAVSPCNFFDFTVDYIKARYIEGTISE